MVGSHISCGVFDKVPWLNWQDCTYTDRLAVFRFQWDRNEHGFSYLSSLLQPDEILRSQRYFRLEDRQRYVYGRAILRILSGAYIGQRPDQIRIETGLNKKPIVVNDGGWGCNLSHSGNWIVLAIAQGDVGIDIEHLKPDFPFYDLFSTSFSQSEQQFIEAGTKPGNRFYQLWTRKEALIKASGKGIDEDFVQIPSLAGQYEVPDNLLGKAENWEVNSFSISSDYAAAVAYSLTLVNPKFYTLNSVLFDETESKWRI
ncbi:4'-phosphopantetheinyl transferase superfamily protein [Spirosoma aerophilum]